MDKEVATKLAKSIMQTIEQARVEDAISYGEIVGALEIIKFGYCADALNLKEKSK